MSLLDLVHPRETRKLPTQRLQDACTLFAQNTDLLRAPYALKSRVSLEDFRAFVAALEDRPPSITPKNFPGLLRLCDEFGFEALSVRLSDFLRSGDRELRRRVLALEEGAIARERQIEAVELELGRRLASEADLRGRLDSAFDRISGLETSIAGLRAEIESLSGRMEIVAVPAAPAAPPVSLLDSVIEPLLPLLSSGSQPRRVAMIGPSAGKTSFLFRVVLDSFENYSSTIAPTRQLWEYRDVQYSLWDTAGQQKYRALTVMYLRNVDAFLLFLDMTARESFEEMQSWLQIIEEYPPKRGVLLIGTKSDLAHERQISTEEARQFAADRGFRYAEVSSLTGDGVEEAIAQMHSMFPAVELRLLWRGSRDGFSGEAFHRCCDGRDRTVTLVRDTQGNVFGGFAVPAWESPFFSKRKGDLSSESFLFTLKNPHDLPPQRFQLIKGQESSAIRVSSRTCSCFGDDDLFICGDCDRSPSHSRGFGSTYENTTGIDGRLVFTGSDTFIVQEIEVLEVVKGPCIL